jgi:hypothetical protein
MTVTLGEIAARLAALEDKEAIRALKARYLRACDLKHVEDVRDCFATGPIRIAYENFPEFTDRDAFVAIYEQMACNGGVYDHPPRHKLGNRADRRGCRATGKWSLNFRTILTGPRQIVRLAVEYEDVYEKPRWPLVDRRDRQQRHLDAHRAGGRGWQHDRPCPGRSASNA